MVLLIRVTSGADISAYGVVSGLFPISRRTSCSTSAKRHRPRQGDQARHRPARHQPAASIVDTLNGEHYIKAVVGIGTPIANVKDLAQSFKEAQIAMEVGKVFDTEQAIVSYDHLGIARLIYQLPTTLCEMLLKEVFKQGSIESLDAETLFTIQRFFENNLNVSETSRGLFVHRNTLVYRLEKIKKLTGLDLREFDDAIVFKVALMVKKYLSANPAKY
ncbi:MAG: PucR family transcriptional regulator [Ruthenibacterium lactatiformans]